MATARIGERTIQPVTRLVAGSITERALEPGHVLGAWAGIVDGVKQQAVAVTYEGVVLFLDGGCHEWPWESITNFAADGSESASIAALQLGVWTGVCCARRSRRRSTGSVSRKHRCGERVHVATVYVASSAEPEDG